MTKIGLYMGRFQPFHRGHMYVLRNALEDCDHLIVAIGSAQASNTIKNPFSYQERVDMIVKCLSDEDLFRITFVGIDDRETISDDCSWGEYLLEQVEKKTGLRPQVSYSGVEAQRSHWFDTVGHIDEVVYSRNFKPYSATMIREALMNNDKETFYEAMPNFLWDEFLDMQDRLKCVVFSRRFVIEYTEIDEPCFDVRHVTLNIQNYRINDTLEAAIKRFRIQHPDADILSAEVIE